MIALNIVMAGFLVAVIKKIRFGLLLLPAVFLAHFFRIDGCIPGHQWRSRRISWLAIFCYRNLDCWKHWSTRSVLPHLTCTILPHLRVGICIWTMVTMPGVWGIMTHKRSLLPTLWSAQPDPHHGVDYWDRKTWTQSLLDQMKMKLRMAESQSKTAMWWEN